MGVESEYAKTEPLMVCMNMDCDVGYSAVELRISLFGGTHIHLQLIRDFGRTVRSIIMFLSTLS